jgi:hypothetical protein
MHVHGTILLIGFEITRSSASQSADQDGASRAAPRAGGQTPSSTLRFTNLIRFFRVIIDMTFIVMQELPDGAPDNVMLCEYLAAVPSSCAPEIYPLFSKHPCVCILKSQTHNLPSCISPS